MSALAFYARLGDTASRLIIEGAIAERVIGRRHRIDEALRKGWRGTANVLIDLMMPI